MKERNIKINLMSSIEVSYGQHLKHLMDRAKSSSSKKNEPAKSNENIPFELIEQWAVENPAKYWPMMNEGNIKINLTNSIGVV